MVHMMLRTGKNRRGRTIKEDKLKKLIFIGFFIFIILFPYCKKTPTSPEIPGKNPPIIKYFTANPNEISYGESFTLSWEVTNATEVEIDQGIGTVSLTGSVEVSLQITTTYTLTAINNDGQTTKSVQVKAKAVANIIIVNCQSTLYPELCDFVSTYFSRAGVPISIIQRNYYNLSDIVNSQLNGIDLLIISGSQSFFPDSPEVEEVATLLRMVIQQNKYAFGVCFGLQLLAYLLDPEEGKLVREGSWDEDITIDILNYDVIFEGVGMPGNSFVTRQYHNYSVPFSKKTKLGQGQILAKSKDGIEIIRIDNVVTTQFHPESHYASIAAKRVFQNYLNEFISKLKITNLFLH